MMKKIVLRLICCTAVLMLLCASSALADARVSITELVQSTPDYWESPLVVDGEQVIMPIYVPKVEKIPVLHAEWEEISVEEHEAIFSSDMIVRVDDYHFSNYRQLVPIEGNVSTLCKANINLLWSKQWIATQASIFTDESIWNTDDELRPETTYAKNNSQSLSDVIQWAEELFGHLYGSFGGGAFFESAQIKSPYMYYKNDMYTDNYPLGKLTGVGGYALDGVQTLRGIPVFDSVISGNDSPASSGIKGALRRTATASIFRYYSNEHYSVYGMPWREKDVITEDIPLCPLDTILAGIQTEIERGRIKNLYCLKLGFVIFADKDWKYTTSRKKPWKDEQFILVPTWICECSYSYDPNRDFKYPEREEPDAYDYRGHDWLYTRLMFNAQTGKLYDPQNASESAYYAPKIETW